MKTYINGHCIEQVLTNAVELTTAQYNALSPELKAHGTYIITDAEAPNISASNVSYDMGGGITTDVQTAIDNKVSKSGDTMTGTLQIEAENSGTSMVTSQINLGNNIATGTEGNSAGAIALFADSQYCSYMVARNLTADRVVYFPNKGGTVCLLESLITGTFNQNVEVTANTYYQTTVDWTGIDKSKVLFSWVWWSNPTQDIPAQLVKYYDGANPAVLHIIGHKWSVDQTVKFKICYILKG